MTPRIGRPPSDNPRTHMVTLRLTDDELAACKAAADKAGQSIGPWARGRILAAAKRGR